jgi:hypothetical protein
MRKPPPAVFSGAADTEVPTITTLDEGNIYKYDGFLLVKNQNILYNGQVVVAWKSGKGVPYFERSWRESP